MLGRMSLEEWDHRAVRLRQVAMVGAADVASSDLAASWSAPRGTGVTCSAMGSGCVERAPLGALQLSARLRSGL